MERKRCDQVWREKKIERERNMFHYFYAVQIFYMPGVLVNEIWYGISQCMRFIPFNYDNNKILSHASPAMPIEKNQKHTVAYLLMLTIIVLAQVTYMAYIWIQIVLIVFFIFIQVILD